MPPNSNVKSLSPYDFSVRVPATSANLGPGFDSFGLALKLYNRFLFTASTDGKDQLAFAEGTCVAVEGVSTRPEESLLFQALNAFYQELGKPRPFLQAAIEAHIPLARGLGSSSSVIVAGLMAANHLEGDLLPKADLLRLANRLEGHPDNVAPAIWGGCLLCDGDRAYSLAWPSHWKIVVAVPAYPLLTCKAREVLPRHYGLQDAVFNLRKASLLTYSLLKADEAAFQESLLDKLHQPYRSCLIPEFEALQQIAKTHGAFGTVISGAGPSVAIFYPETAQTGLLEALKTYKASTVPDLRLLSLEIDGQGAHIVKGDS